MQTSLFPFKSEDWAPHPYHSSASQVGERVGMSRLVNHDSSPCTLLEEEEVSTVVTYLLLVWNLEEATSEEVWLSPISQAESLSLGSLSLFQGDLSRQPG
jgi:hypothetical protein